MPKQAADSEKVGGQPLPNDVADLVNKKIREFEQSCNEENEKTLKAQKGRARAVAKTKLKEAKQIMNTGALASEKVKTLWERLQAEHEQAEGFIVKATADIVRSPTQSRIAMFARQN